MGRGGLHLGIGALDDQDVPVAHPRLEMKDVGSAVRLQGGDQRVGFFVADMARRKVDHPDMSGHGKVHGGHIAAEGRLVAFERDAHGSGLQRRPAGIVLLRPVAQQGEVGHVATRRIARRDRPVQKDLPLAAEFVHGRCHGRLEGGLVADFGYRQIAHAVTNEYQIFHGDQ